MKKITIIIVMAVLCLNFRVNAQENKAIDVTTKGLQVGQQVPDFTITNLHNYKDALGKPATTAKLSDFKGKLLILDFWATWCSPCVGMIPRMDNLQKKFKDKIQFLSVTYETAEVVLPFLAKWEKQHALHPVLPISTSNISLKELFPHVYLPHYIWIDGKGIVRAITSLREVNELEISRAIEQNYASLSKKQDFKIAWDKDKPLFVNGNGGDGSTMMYHSLLSPYILGIPAGFTFTPPINGKDGFSKTLARNVPMAHMFRTALQRVHKKQFTESKCIYEIKDSLNIIPSLMWSRRQQLSMTYELVLPPALQAKGNQIMLDDLVKLFPQYTVTVEKRKTLCYALRKLPNTEIIASAGGEEKINGEAASLQMRNGSVNLLINFLDFYYFSDAKIPIVNLVEDKTLTDIIINAPLTDAAAINLELTKYGLELVKGEFEIDMIVYRDSVK